MHTLFLIEDNERVREAVAESFRVSGYKVVEFDKAAGVEEAFRVHEPDAIILDVMLPDTNGFILAKQLRKQSDVPITFLTVRGEESDRLTGFEVGADDYVVKPFSTKELMLRVEAVLKRVKRREQHRTDCREWMHNGTVLSIDLNARRAFLDRKVLQLTNSEWEILSYLALRPGWAIPRERILEECLGYLYPSSERTVDTHVSNLRAKLADGPWIETVRGYGYRFVPE